MHILGPYESPDTTVIEVVGLPTNQRCKAQALFGSSKYQILLELDLNMFETTTISALLGKLQNGPETDQDPIQQNLFPTLGH